MQKEYLTVSNIVGPLVIVEKIRDVKYNELVEIETADGLMRWIDAARDSLGYFYRKGHCSGV